jgi:acetyl esterase/lipase
MSEQYHDAEILETVNYTPSPESRYPVALEQAYAATKWVAENGRTTNVNSSRLVVVGDSVPDIRYIKNI